MTKTGSHRETASSEETPNTSWSTEVLAGVTTFLTMAYITVVNPAILSSTGMPLQDVFFATCVSAAIATFVMALWARYPFALAPGMGLNAFFAFVVCGQMGIPWQTALAAVFVSGIVFLALSFVGLREKIISTVPSDLVRAIAAGIGLFIAFIGLEHAGIVADHPETLVTLGNITSPATLSSLAGLGLTVALISARVPGAVIIGIAITAVITWIAGIAPPPDGIVRAPSLPSQTLGAALFALKDLARPEIIMVVFTMLFLDLFDTMGTLLALGYTTGHIGKDGRLPRAKQAFTSDAIGTLVGSLLGTSTVTTYIESAAGVVTGGRTGRTALVTGILFLLALPFFPIIAAVPAIATAPALIVVGALMFAGASEINWKDPVIAIPALATVLVMPATFNISNGLGAGFILYAITHLAARRTKDMKPATYIIAGAFLIYFAIGTSG
ncbi:MAG: NCS2 family permease [Deltaproteobacteria bacterium]|nr:NCS2 family permease [Deltaproteobacteria bacterium]